MVIEEEEPVRRKPTSFSFPLLISNSREEIILNKYKISSRISESTFSYIHICTDILLNQQFIVKIIKNQKIFFDQSIHEIRMLLHMNTYSEKFPDIVFQLKDFFYYNHQLLIITEMLSESLYYKVIKPKMVLDPNTLKAILHQIFQCLAMMQEVGVIHCDIKPENLCFVTLQFPKLKVIDYGSAMFIEDSDNHCELQTLPY